MSVAMLTPPDQIRLHRAPPIDPPFDDELFPSLFQPHLHEAYFEPSALVTTGSSQEGHAAALRFLNLCVELFNGFRSPMQMRPLLDLQHVFRLHDELADIARHLSRFRHPRSKVKVRRTQLRTCEPVPGVIEVAAVLSDGTRTWALCYRIELQDTDWRCTFIRALLPSHDPVAGPHARRSLRHPHPQPPAPARAQAPAGARAPSAAQPPAPARGQTPAGARTPSAAQAPSPARVQSPAGARPQPQARQQTEAPPAAQAQPHAPAPPQAEAATPALAPAQVSRPQPQARQQAQQQHKGGAQTAGPQRSRGRQTRPRPETEQLPPNAEAQAETKGGDDDATGPAPASRGTKSASAPAKRRRTTATHTDSTADSDTRIPRSM